MHRPILTTAATLALITLALTQLPAQDQAKAGKGKGGPPANPATAADVADMAKLAQLPAYTPTSGDGDFSIGPEYTPAPEETLKVGTPHGKVVEFYMPSKDSKIYPGTPAPFDRLVSVYIPAQYVPGTPAPFIFSADSYGLQNRQLANILDNMIAARRLPAMVAIMVANGGAERSLEYDTVTATFADFVETEVLPRVEKETGVKLTKDPDARMTYGGSSGAAMAMTMAWFKPELYHRILSYSGTFVDLQRGPQAPHGAWEYHENFFANNPVRPYRIWMHVSENDLGVTSASADRRNWVIANQRLAGVLKAKGYHYQFVYGKNAGHVDSKVIRQTLPQALEYVWQGYKPGK